MQAPRVRRVTKKKPQFTNMPLRSQICEANSIEEVISFKSHRCMARHQHSHGHENGDGKYK